MPPRLKAPGAPIVRRRPTSKWWLVPIVVLALIAVGIAVVPSSPEPPVDVEAAEGSSELLDGLRPGDSIAGWRVHVMRVLDRQLGLDLTSGKDVVTVWIAKKGELEAPAPRETDRYAIYYGFPPESQPAALRDMETLLTEVETRIRRTEATVPPPPGL
jgi:hypothetical protein